MQWEWMPARAALPLAAHLVTARRGYTHHGIYVGNGNVVHYPGLVRGRWGTPVEEVSLAAFARGRGLWVRPHVSPRFDRHAIVARARSRIGENCYRILSNNCEHFCEWCVRGESRSAQVERLLAAPRRALRTIVSWIGRTAGAGSMSFSASARK